MFQLIDATTGVPVNDTVYTSYSDALAARVDYIDIKTRIQPYVDNSWRVREEARFLDGDYERLPDYIQTFTVPDHYAHVSKTDSSKVAFTASPEKGMTNTKTVVTASSYLGRFASERLKPHEIRDLAARYEMRNIVNDSTLVISHERSAFRFAYDSQPVKSESSDHISCMAKPARYYTHGLSNPLHPAEAYATGDRGLYIAYTTDPTNPQIVTARAVLWPTNMYYVRVYGLDENYRRSLTILLGFKGYERSDSFDGAPLARIPVDPGVHATDEDGRFLMPYIDGDDKYISDSPGEKRFYVCDSGSGNYRADDTIGIVHVGRTGCRCENCGGRLDEDDDQFIVDDDQVWCMGCFDNEAFTCERNGSTYSNSNGDPTTVNRRERRTYGPHAGEWRTFTEVWCSDAARYYAFHCEHTDEWYCQRSYTSIGVTTNTRRGTETWCHEACEGDFFACPDCDEYFALDMAHPDSVGTGALRCVDCYNEHNADQEARGYPKPTFVDDPHQTTLALPAPVIIPLF